MKPVKTKAKIGFVLLFISLVFFAISSVVDTAIPITILGSDGVLRIFFVIGVLFLFPSFFLLTKRYPQVQGRYRRTLDIFE